MKKHLIAAAVAAAVAVPAAAQVSISGMFDFALQERDNGTSTITSGNSGTLSTPNLRFTSAEDLGGGLKLSFTALAEFSASAGTYEQSTAGFDQVFASVSGGFGTVTVGKHGFAARNANGVGSFIGNVGLVGSVAGVAQRALGDEKTGSVSYATPVFSGASAAFSMSPRSTARSAGAAGNSATGTGEVTGLHIQYSKGPLNVAYSRLEADVTAISKQETDNIAASYDFGIARIGLVRNENTPTTASAAVQHKTTVLQASVPFGSTSLIAAIHDYNGEVASGDAPKAKTTVIGAVHNLSKRTNVYAVYADTDNNSAAAYHITSQGTATVGLDQTTISVGLRHSF